MNIDDNILLHDIISMNYRYVKYENVSYKSFNFKSGLSSIEKTLIKKIKSGKKYYKMKNIVDILDCLVLQINEILDNSEKYTEEHISQEIMAYFSNIRLINSIISTKCLSCLVQNRYTEGFGKAFFTIATLSLISYKKWDIAADFDMLEDSIVQMMNTVNDSCLQDLIQIYYQVFNCFFTPLNSVEENKI